ncbi:MAG: amidohydrolase family protein, partial [Euryarchaeota archaeon]
MDESSRAEFDILVQNDLLVGELNLIHGTALTKTEFDKMGAVGANLVWSPLSNLLLYGTTTDVAAAKDAGVRISIAPDWAPSGSKSPLHELKVADLWDDEMLGDIFNDYEMVQMVTSNPAKAMKWDQFVGTIEVGKAADLVVLDNINTNPYRNMINAIDTDVRLTVIGGIPIYGDQDIMTEMKGDDWEPAGLGKALDVTFIGVEDGGQTWGEIVSDLEMAMRFDYDEMKDAFGENMADFDNQVANMVNVGLDPVHTWGDERYFRVINNSNSANSQIDMSLLYDRYYDRPATIDTVIGEEGNYTENNPVSHTYGCMDDTALNFNADATKDDGSCTFQQQNTTQQTNNSD